MPRAERRWHLAIDLRTNQRTVPEMFVEVDVFFYAENGLGYPLAAVERVRKIKARNVAMIAVGGEELEVSLAHWERAVEHKPLSLATAQEGTYVLQTVCTDDGDVYEKINVVAWATLLNGEVVPVTPDGIDDRSRPVLLPDGKVIEPEIMSHESLTEFLEHHQTKLWEQAA